MTDRELLEAAAKAAGIIGIDGIYPIARDSSGECHFWNPLTDDGDALRLAVTIGIHITNSTTDAWASTLETTAIETIGDDPYAATRRAIVRAAADIGKGMK